MENNATYIKWIWDSSKKFVYELLVFMFNHDDFNIIRFLEIYI
jgi:hypothetical protein